MKDATKFCWRLAHAVTRERDRDWKVGYKPWAVMVCDIERDRPKSAPGRQA